MKIRVLSDLHIEFMDNEYDPGHVDCDAVVLAGDIGVGLAGIQWAQYMFAGTPVIYVMGNHEYYRREYMKTLYAGFELAAGSNVHLLENTGVTIGGVRFLGCTLWSDFDLYPGQMRRSMELARRGIADYSLIKADPVNPIRPEDTQRLHHESAEWLLHELEKPHAGKTVVVSHHSPTIHGSDPRFDGDDLAPYFSSNLHHMMGPPVDAWLFGHTHWSTDFVSGEPNAGTRIVSNQKGYPYEGGANARAFDPSKLIEI